MCVCVRAPLIMVKAFSIDFYSQNTSQPIDSLWFCSLHTRVNPSGEPQILTKTCVKKPLVIPLKRAHTPAVIYREYRLISKTTSSAFPQFHSRFLCSLTARHRVPVAAFLRCTLNTFMMTCDLFPLVNVTQTTGGGGRRRRRRGSKNSIAHCAPSEKLGEMRRKCQFLFFFSPGFGIYQQPKYALARAQRKHFKLHTRVRNVHSATLAPPPFPHILRARGRVKCCVGQWACFSSRLAPCQRQQFPLFKSH